MAAALLLGSSAVAAQTGPQPRELSQQLIDAVRDGDEAGLIALLGKPTGRQELLALSDDSFVFEMRAAKLLAALQPQSAGDRKLVWRAELSLLHQTDEENVVNELIDSILAREPEEGTDPAVAIRLADEVYSNIRQDLNDAVMRHGEVVAGEKSRALAATAGSMLGVADDPGRVAFLKEILARAHVPPHPSAEAPQVQVPVGAPLSASARETTATRNLVWKQVGSWVGRVLMLLLALVIGWRINTFRR
jgi:hypothetical protein